MYKYIHMTFFIFKLTNLHNKSGELEISGNHGNLKSPRKYLLISFRYLSAYAFRKLNVIRSH